MPQVTITDVPQRVPLLNPEAAPGYSLPLEALTIQVVSGAPVEFAPRSGLTYGGATGGLRMQANGNASPVKVDRGVYAVCATGTTAVLAYEYC